LKSPQLCVPHVPRGADLRANTNGQDPGELRAESHIESQEPREDYITARMLVCKASGAVILMHWGSTLLRVVLVLKSPSYVCHVCHVALTQEP